MPVTFHVEAEEADSREPWGVYVNDEAEREGAGPSNEKFMDMGGEEVETAELLWRRKASLGQESGGGLEKGHHA